MSDLTSPQAFQNPSEYYSSFEKRPDLRENFHDIDEKASFQEYLHLLQDSRTHNFVLDFGNKDAWCATNLEKEDIESLLRTPVSCIV